LLDLDSKIKFSFDVVSELEKLDKKIRNVTMRKTMNKAAKPVKDAVITNAPERYGFLKKSFRIKVIHYKDRKVWCAIIGPKSDFKRNKGKYKRGPKAGQAYVHRPAKYAHLVDKGTQFITAKEFLVTSLNETHNQYVRSVEASVKEAIAQSLNKK